MNCRKQWRMFFHHAIQMGSINNLQETAVCKERHNKFMVNIHIHCVTNRQTLPLNTNEVDMIFPPCHQPLKEILSISRSKKSPSNMTPNTYFSIFHFYCLFVMFLYTTSIIFQGSNWSDSHSVWKTCFSRRAPQHRRGMSDEVRIAIFQGGHPVTSDSPQLLPSTQSADHLEGE